MAAATSAAAHSGESANGPTITLGNQALSATWSTDKASLQGVLIEDRVNKKRITLSPDVFTLLLKDGTTLKSSAMRVNGPVRSEALGAQPNAARAAERLNGRQYVADLTSADGRLLVTWRAILREGSFYLRQEVTIRAAKEDVPISDVQLVDIAVQEAHVAGTVKGSPVVAGGMYFSVEHPLSSCTASAARIACSMKRELPLRGGTSVTYSSVIGTTRPGQLRRDFLMYLERERAHPYRGGFLHYNSWYDIGYFGKFDERDALAVIDAYGRELTEKRGVTLSSFLFDDGWDDASSLWRFHSGFPNGFTPLKEEAAKYGAAPGVWLSPWGGYGKMKQERLKYGAAQGFEITNGGFALSGPKYYQRFHDTCLEMIRTYGVNQFKFDGAGNVNSAIPGSEFDSDFSAAIALIDDLRREKPDIYINLTTGTYPSPFWLRYADSIWRGGEDHSFAGVGTKRQQWITYRDANIYKGIVQRGPLFPLNSLMLHGLIYAKRAKDLETDPGHDFAEEVHSYFGTGTQLQEMYVTPSLLTADDWDTIAEAAKWARANADVLVDSHWIGGDPNKLEVYGCASWSSRKGILTLRNPLDKPQALSLDVAEAFELPSGAARSFRARSPWHQDAARPAIALRGGEKHVFELKPFEVLTLDMEPTK